MTVKPMIHRLLSAFLILATVFGGCRMVFAEAPDEFAGTWVYKLGPNTLFALRLEPSKTADGVKTGQVHGYLLRPEHFSMQSPGGTVFHFSHITNTSVREPVVSTGFRDGELRLVDEAAKPADKAAEPIEFRVRGLDGSHIAFRLFGPLEPLRLEKSATNEPTLTSDWDETRSYSEDDFAADNAEMMRLVDADQKDRNDGVHIDWKTVEKADEARRQVTATLLREGKLHTGHDYESAALVFQHGGTPDDYLMAHALAMVAVSKGQSGAVWISTATLDRYLQSIHQPQIFGTQFNTPGKEPTTQEPYNRSLISDALRGQLGVPSQAEQDKQRRQYDTKRGLP